MKILPAYVFCFFLVLLGTPFSFAQEKLRTVVKSATVQDEPVEIISVHIGEKALNVNNQVRAEKDWLKNVTLSVKNVSNKAIVYLKIHLRVAKQENMLAQMLIPLQFGTLPRQKFPDPNSDWSLTKDKMLNPNEVVKIRVSQQIANSVDEQFQEQGVDVERVEFVYDFVVFEDGLAWTQGTKMRQDPDNPRNWILVGNDLVP